jgi:predicted ABC-type ATPase
VIPAADTPRLRMFAGPNGSGKSTLYRRLQSLVLRPAIFGIYLNPDEIEARLRQTGILDLSAYGVAGPADDLIPYLQNSGFLRSVGLVASLRALTVSDEVILHFNELQPNAYHASVIADFIRRRLLAQRSDFTFETVMSSPDKVALLKEAQGLGYRTYLYFVATDDPIINVSRVKSRVNLGGHAVPEEKIVERYHRSVGLLREAVRHTDRAYIFDNSGDEQDHTWLAEITGGRDLELKSGVMPAWFEKALIAPHE